MKQTFDYEPSAGASFSQFVLCDTGIFAGISHGDLLQLNNCSDTLGFIVKLAGVANRGQLDCLVIWGTRVSAGLVEGWEEELGGLVGFWLGLEEELRWLMGWWTE